jgi:parvulin-like peptidyl-prolyl isomerase
VHWYSKKFKRNSEQIQQASPEIAQVSQSLVTPEMIEARVAQVQAELNAQMLQGLMPQGDQQDPLVAIRQQELAIKAADVERKAKLDQAELALEQQKMMQRAATDAARIESQEEIAENRNDVNMERISVQRENMMRRNTT